MGLVPHGLEGGKAAADHVIRDAVADPEVFLAAKAGAGDDKEVLFLRQVREDVGVAIGSLDEEIERAVGLGHRIAHFRQLIIEQRAVFVIRLEVRRQLDAPGDDPLQQAGRADMAAGAAGPGDGGKDRLTVCCSFGDIDVPDALARQAQRLGPGVADDGVFIDRRDKRDLDAAVDQLPVGLVGDEIDGYWGS